MTNVDAVSLLKRFHQLQGERVQTYSLFEDGYKAYLSASPNYNFPMYRQLVHEVTETFKKISTEIMDIENKIKTDHSLPVIGKCIGLVQDAERRKLELIAQVQIARQNAIDHLDDTAHQENVNDLQKRIREVVDEINEHMEELKYESEDLLSS